MKKLSVLFSITMLLLTAAAFAEDSLGRDIVDRGDRLTLSGVLFYDGTEWHLDVDGTSYLLHLGNHEFIEDNGIVLEAGAEVRVYGFAADEEISPITITVADEVTAFRDEDGRPLWAGAGNYRRNEQEDRFSRGNGGSVGSGDSRGFGRGLGRL